MKAKYLLLLLVLCALSCEKDNRVAQDTVKEFRYLYSVVPTYWPLVFDTILRASDDSRLKMIFSIKEGKSCYLNESMVFRCHATESVSYWELSPSANQCPEYDESSYHYSIACGEAFDYIVYQEGEQLYARFFELPFDFLQPYGPCSYSVWSYEWKNIDY